MNKSKVCHIFGAGDFFGIEEKICDDDIIIAADGGLNALNVCGAVPHYIIGDFDSLGYIPDLDNITVLPTEKDTTDMFEAVSAGVKKGCEVFHVYGGTGGRLDHTVANIQMLKFFSEKGIKLHLYGENFVITAVTDSRISISGKSGDYVSVFALSDKAEGVTLSGLKYKLDNYTLTNAFPLGVSNEFTENAAEISVENGTLAVYYTTRKD